MSIDKKSSLVVRCFTRFATEYCCRRRRRILFLSSWSILSLLLLLLLLLFFISFGISILLCVCAASYRVTSLRTPLLLLGAIAVFISCAHFDTEVAIGVVLIGLHYVTEKNDQGYDSCVLRVQWVYFECALARGGTGWTWVQVVRWVRHNSRCLWNE